MSKIAIKQAVILAGGLGTRLRPITTKIPKPMIKFQSHPFLEYLILMLKEKGIKEVILLLGYLPEKIVQYFGNGSKWGVKIKYSITPAGWDSGRRVKAAKKMFADYFLLVYCDNYWPLDLKILTSFFQEKKGLTCLTVYSNKDNFTKNNILVGENGLVLKYDPERKTKDLNGVEIGFFIINKKVLQFLPKTDFCFEKTLIPFLINKKQLYGFVTDHRYYSISKLERLPLTKEFFKPKKVVFLDRDGVINKKMPPGDYVKKWHEFKFIPGVIKGLKLLTKEKFEIFIVTNQAGIGRRLMTKKDLTEIHKNMKNILIKHGIKIKKIYYCPHNWDDHCECRKPKPGQFFQAAREYNIDLTKSYFISDDKRDIKAGKLAGCKTFLLSSKKTLLKTVNDLIKEEENEND